MQIYSDKLTRDELDGIAANLGMELYNADADFSGARRRRMRLTLRPVTDRFRARREDPYCKSGYRNLWAVSYMGHWHFMHALLVQDPDAEIKSALAHWKGLEDFETRTPKLQDERDQMDFRTMHMMVG